MFPVTYGDVPVLARTMSTSAEGGLLLRRVSSAKRVHLAGIFLPVTKTTKVHKMCARYSEIPDMKLRRGLGLGPIVNWFVPAPRPFGDDASRVGLGIF